MFSNHATPSMSSAQHPCRLHIFNEKLAKGSTAPHRHQANDSPVTIHPRTSSLLHCGVLSPPTPPTRMAKFLPTAWPSTLSIDSEGETAICSGGLLTILLTSHEPIQLFVSTTSTTFIDSNRCHHHRTASA